MEPNELLDIMHIVTKLKAVVRHCATDENRMESVADHCFSMAFMAMLIEDHFQDLDMHKVICMCLIHDLGEAFTMDIPTFIKTKEDEDKEFEIYLSWVKELPVDIRDHFTSLIEEMNALKTREAKLYKALDKMDALIAHNESDISTWLPLEYDLQYTYGKKECSFDPFIQSLRDAIDEQTSQKIKSGK